MSGLLKMSRQMTFGDIEDVISSAASESGITPSGSPDSPLTEKYGPLPAHANLSHRQAKAARLTTSGTYGPLSSGSSVSADLSYSLANRLIPLTDSLGSTLFTMTWKRVGTPSGRSLPLLRASVRPTDDTASTGLQNWHTPDAKPERPNSNSNCVNVVPGLGNQAQLTAPLAASAWPTPQALEQKESSEAKVARGAHAGLNLAVAAQMTATQPATARPSPVVSDATRGNNAGRYENGTNRGGPELGTVAMLTTWPSPTATLSDKGVRSLEGAQREAMRNHGPDLAAVASLTACSTPSVSDGTGGHERRRRRAVKRTAAAGEAKTVIVPSASSWTTPTGQDASNNAGPSQMERNTLPLNAQVQLTASGETPTGSPAPTASRGQLNPALSRWLMGLPVSWDLCALRVVPTVRTRNVSSTPRSSKKGKPAPCDSGGTATQSLLPKPQRSSGRSSKRKPPKAA